MAARKDIDGSASVPAFYGKELRWKRERAGLTLEQAVEGSFYGVSYLSEIERGNRNMPADLAAHIDRVLGTDGYFGRNCGDVRRSRRNGHADYFVEIVGMEGRARDVVEWCPQLVPGPLQLKEYIRAIIHANHPFDSEESVEAKVTARRDRAWVFEDAAGPASWVVMHESILRQPLVEPGLMAEQLAHVADVARRRRFIPQILPCDAGAHPFMMGTTWLMQFPDAPPVMYTEGMYSGQVIDDQEVVAQYQGAYERLRAAALPPKDSLKMIEDAAEGFRNVKPVL
ncbi:helix-turn-helix transcriptional regulator [Streptomyces sp. NPDC050856]|uniref:helix-turn-helix domain-containing protein n=1 Tax=Streptomyces sp. NPDC050856 TaxID=3154939 RepID=UPI0033D3944A